MPESKWMEPTRVTISVTPSRVGKEPALTVYAVHMDALPRASWDERFGLKEIAEVFLLGVKAGADLFANIKINLPDVSPDKTTRAETDLQETSSSGDR